MKDCLVFRKKFSVGIVVFEGDAEIHIVNTVTWLSAKIMSHTKAKVCIMWLDWVKYWVWLTFHQVQPCNENSVAWKEKFKCIALQASLISAGTSWTAETVQKTRVKEIERPLFHFVRLQRQARQAVTLATLAIRALKIKAQLLPNAVTVKIKTRTRVFSSVWKVKSTVHTSSCFGIAVRT